MNTSIDLGWGSFAPTNETNFDVVLIGEFKPECGNINTGFPYSSQYHTRPDIKWSISNTSIGIT